MALCTPASVDWLLAQRRGVAPTNEPLLSITNPTRRRVLLTGATNLNLAGSAAALGRDVTRVTWTNFANNAKGVASGTNLWSVTNIPLVANKTNVIVVVATTTSWAPAFGGNTTFNDTLTVIQSPIRATLALQGTRSDPELDWRRPALPRATGDRSGRGRLDGFSDQRHAARDSAADGPGRLLPHRRTMTRCRLVNETLRSYQTRRRISHWRWAVLLSRGCEAPMRDSRAQSYLLRPLLSGSPLAFELSLTSRGLGQRHLHASAAIAASKPAKIAGCQPDLALSTSRHAWREPRTHCPSPARRSAHAGARRNGDHIHERTESSRNA